MKLQQIVNVTEGTSNDAAWQDLDAFAMFQYAADHLSAEEFDALKNKLDGLNAFDRADHPQAKQIMTKFLTSHLR